MKTPLHWATVQFQCIPQAIMNQDVICQAKSGMGKTAVFVLSTLHQLEPKEGQVSVVVLCHSRELAVQIHGEYERFSKYLPDVTAMRFVGGERVVQNVAQIEANCPVRTFVHPISSLTYGVSPTIEHCCGDSRAYQGLGGPRSTEAGQGGVFHPGRVRPHDRE